MEHEEPGGAAAGDNRDDLDREVSRQVRNPTEADPGDDAVYAAADPVPDDADRPPGSAEFGGAPEPASAAPTESGGGGSTERAAAEVAGADESEPDRSE